MNPPAANPAWAAPAAGFPAPSDADRAALQARPRQAVSFYHKWRLLSFVHWRLPPEVVAPLLPAELTLDTFDGSAWVGLVPFTMHGIRPWWLPALPGLSMFHETNVRTYVHFRGRDPGVWFFSLDAANPVAVFAARNFWHLNYFLARMELFVDGVETAGPIPLDRGRSVRSLLYRSRRPVADGNTVRTPAALEIELAVDSRGTPTEAERGTLEFFLAERYLLYARSASGALFQGQVHHRPYPLLSATVERLPHDGLLRASGLPVSGPPCHALFSPGVDVEVFGLRRLRI